MTIPTYKIHPAIGIARLGNSPDSFYLSPESTGAPPIDCGPDGTPITQNGVEQPVTQYKDAQGRVRRQAARFRIYVYDNANPQGREIKIGDTLQAAQIKGTRRTGQLLTAELIDIQWTGYLANKKSSWYAFQQLEGEHGYLPGHPLRNAEITDPGERQRLIIDPGPRTVSWANPKLRVAQFAQTAPNGTPESFPPELQPNSITTLGALRSTTGAGGHNRLLVLGGLGNSGSAKRGMGQPSIQHYANNDGWFDDTSDGPVNANLVLKVLKIDDHAAPPGMTAVIPVDSPAWVIIGYPRYAPQIVDVVTMDDLVYDVAVRTFNYAPELYKDGEWNSNYYPYFWRDIWPILERPFSYQFVADVDPIVGGDPHQTGKGSGGNMDPDWLSIPPHSGENSVECENRRARRALIYTVLRKDGQENRLYAAHPKKGRILYAMPLLCGDNPLSNDIPSKYLRLTGAQLFLLRQWAEGKFVNEKLEDITPPPLPEPVALDRGVLGNALGGAFCPGAEAAWIMRNPAIYSGAYRIKPAASWTPGSLSQPGVVSGADTTASLAAGSEPGDLTKYSAVPWQSDFNECTNQDIDITYESWNSIDASSTGDTFKDQTFTVYWWPAHRPVMVSGAAWSPAPNTNSGDLEMVSVWSLLGFVVPAADWTVDTPDFQLVENAIGG
ncbi:MAG: LodA/GoxA family CTQ-dependent oxidase [Bryobacteraceae bacterium]